jgi:hypothetical protein
LSLIDQKRIGLQVNGDLKGVLAGPYSLSYSLSKIEMPKAVRKRGRCRKGIDGRQRVRQ